MKRTITTMVLAAIMLVAAAPAAFATHVEDKSQDGAGHGTTECRPGADFDLTSGLVGSWTLMSKADFIADFIEELGYTPNPLAVDATWDFCDKNRDDLLCVLKTDPSPYYYTLLDNRHFPGS